MKKRTTSGGKMTFAAARARIKAAGLILKSAASIGARYHITQSDGKHVKSFLPAEDVKEYARTLPAPVEAQSEPANDLPASLPEAESALPSLCDEARKLVAETMANKMPLITDPTQSQRIENAMILAVMDALRAERSRVLTNAGLIPRPSFESLGIDVEAERAQILAEMKAAPLAAARPGMAGALRLPGTVSITKVSGNMPIPRPVYIEVTDAFSGVQIVKAEISLSDFASAVMGHSTIDCELEIYPAIPLGKVTETKTEIFPRPNYHSTNEEDRELIARRTFEPFERDGWTGRTSDLWNSHNWQRDGDGVRVTFSRYVEPNPEKVAEVWARMERRSKGDI